MYKDVFKTLDTVMIGFEPFFKELEKGIADAGKTPLATLKYPPYNIKKVDDNRYAIEIGVAGFCKQDIDIEMVDGKLIINGKVTNEGETESGYPLYLYRGLASRAFTRTFTLADNVEINNAELLNGVLKIWLEKLTPEEQKPKKIEINEKKA